MNVKQKDDWWYGTSSRIDKSTVLVLTDEEASQLLPIEDYIDAMEQVFKEFAMGKAINRPRVRYTMPTPAPDLIYYSNTHCGASTSYGVAVIRAGSSTLFDIGDARTGATRKKRPKPGPSSRDLSFIYSLETGELMCILPNYSVQAMRVGATIGLGVKYLARDDSHTVGLIGSGKQARSSLRAISKVRPIQKVKVYSTNMEHRNGFADEMSRELGIEVVPVDSAEVAVRGSDIVSCATNSAVPVFDGKWLDAGQTVVGIVNTDVLSFKTEVDETTFVRSDLIVINDKESVFANNQTELLGSIEKGLFSWDKVSQLGDILLGKARGRERPEELIYYKNNTGMAIQFAAAGAVIYQRARSKGIGREIGQIGT